MLSVWYTDCRLAWTVLLLGEPGEFNGQAFYYERGIPVLIIPWAGQFFFSEDLENSHFFLFFLNLSKSDQPLTTHRSRSAFKRDP